MKKLVVFAGIIITLAACAWVSERLIQGGALLQILHTPGLFPAFMGCAGIALLANFCLAGAWATMAAHINREPVDPRLLFVIHGWTQMGKYLPGNFFHIAGRYGMGMGAGLSHGTLAASTLLEPFCLLSLAGLFSLPFVISWLAEHLWLLEALSALIALLAGGIVLALWKLEWLRATLRELLSDIGAFIRRGALLTLSLYALFFVLNGLIVAWLLSAQAQVSFPLWTLISSNAFAWSVGYVTVGAPAGIGVREAALIFALGGGTAQTVIAMAAVYRVASLMGDFMFFLLSGAALKIIERRQAG